jgi:uncharacterized membrane protein YeaQ/YmgE (transglycosylase-associated protein family)
MTIPSLLIGLLISTLYGALFHIWRGGGLGRLFLFILLGWVGFWGGQVLGDVLGWTFLPLGPLNLGLATLGSLLVLLVGSWLSMIEVSRVAGDD